MADKKVERTVRPSEEDRPAKPPRTLATPGEKGGIAAPHQVDQDAKAALLEKFKVREERLREGSGAEAAATLEGDAGTQEAPMEV
jgi:hypothetical protein